MKPDTNIELPRSGQAPSWEAQQMIFEYILKLENKLEAIELQIIGSNGQAPSDLLSLTQGREYIKNKYGLRCSSPQTLSSWMTEHPEVMQPKSKEGRKGAYYARANFDALAKLKKGLM